MRTQPPAFDDYPGYIPSQYDVDTNANDFFLTNYGITIDRMYLYTDSRDSFDGLGIANGFKADIPGQVTGTVNFIDTTDFVNVDWLWIDTFAPTYSIFNSLDVLLDSITLTPGSSTGSFSLYGTDISYLTLFSNAGLATISNLT